MTTKLARLRSRVREAHTRLNQEFEREFPVGARITWLYRDEYIQSGTVEYNYQIGDTAPDMRVLNDRTGKLVWVNLLMQPKCRQDGH